MTPPLGIVALSLAQLLFVLVVAATIVLVGSVLVSAHRSGMQRVRAAAARDAQQYGSGHVTVRSNGEQP